MQVRRGLGAVAQDFRLAIRQSRRNWAFTAIVIATFALGIGASTAMFTVVNTVLIHPLPYLEPDRLVFLGSAKSATSAPDFLDYTARNSVFTSLAIIDRSGATISGDSDPEQVSALDVSTAFFATVGVRPMFGRAFLPDEESKASAVVMFSYDLWMRRYGGDRSVVGRTIVIDGQSALVIGVVPPVIDRNLAGDIYRPFDFHASHATVRAYHTQPVLARLRPGISRLTAQAVMNVVANQLAAAYPEDANHTITVQPYQDVVVGHARSQLLYLLAAVALVLLIACGNIVSLMLTRATTRRQELATRVALGASRIRLIQQMMTESTLLALIGGAFGLLLATTLLHMLRVTGATALPRIAELRLSSAAFGFTGMLSIVAGMAVGTASALQATAAALQPVLNIGGRGSHSRRSGRIREIVVTVQLAVSLVLLAGAAVLMESFWSLAHVNPGFDDRGVLTATVQLPTPRYSFPNAVEWWRTLLPQIAAMPHVVGASAASQLPLAPGGNATYIPVGTTLSPFAPSPSALINIVADRYFETMRIPIVTGTTFSREGSNGYVVEIVVSESVAKTRFRLQNAVGQRMTFPDFGGFTAEVVGVAGDIRASLALESPDVIYFPLRQMRGWARNMRLVVRSDGDPTLLTKPIRRLLAEKDPLLALGNVRTMADMAGRSVARERIEAHILTGFGAVALLLAALGLYGLLAYAVATRAHEFSIRFALGAQRGQLFGMVVRNGMRLVVLGLASGLVLIPMTVRVLQSAFGVTAINVTALVVSVVVLGLIGFSACVVPAVHATRLGSVWTRAD
jgi:putative ABC transport system permease protein